LKKETTYILAFSTMLLTISCSSYKAKKQEALLTFPELGAIIKVKGDLSYEAVEQIGVPHWEQLKVDVQQLPFNRASYLTYAKSKFRAAKRNTIPYKDSLRYPPKYLRVQLLDKLSLTELLNAEESKSIREYLQNDKAHKMVTSLDLALTETDIIFFLGARALQLQKDEFGAVQLVAYSGNAEQRFYFSELEVFQYGYSSFCWDEDQYGTLKIGNITPSGEKCPKGTFLKATKAHPEKEYLKF